MARMFGCLKSGNCCVPKLLLAFQQDSDPQT